jgi:hypothetical protein
MLVTTLPNCASNVSGSAPSASKPGMPEMKEVVDAGGEGEWRGFDAGWCGEVLERGHVSSPILVDRLVERSAELEVRISEVQIPFSCCPNLL